MSLMVSISGIRGIVGQTLIPETVVRYASAYAEYCGRGTVIVGRDGRVTGGTICQIVIAALREMGCDVVSLGICPTPTVALAVERLHAAGGISITASHNPMVWNGLKFFASSGLFLDAAENRAFWNIADRGSFQYRPWDQQGGFRSYEAFLDEHIESVLTLPLLNVEAIRERRFKVVLDCVNAAGGIIVPRLLERLGCDVVPIHCEPTGVFGHTPEPIPENLTDLASAVKKEGADLGIAVDPDVDRLVLITETGEPYGEENTIATCVRFILVKEPAASARPCVAVNLSTTRAVEDIVRAADGRLLKTPVGEINVAKAMVEAGAIIGGEGSGGVIYPRVHPGRDAIVGIGLILQALLESGGTLTSLKRSLPQYFITKGKVDLGMIDADAVLMRLQKTYSSKGTITTADGLKIDFPRSWVHLRKSNTEPIIRIIAEAATKPEADDLVRSFTNEILGRQDAPL